MAIVAEMEREAVSPEADRPGEAPGEAVLAAPVLDAINGAVERAIAAHLRSRRAGWQTAVIGVLAAGLIALAGVAYSTLRSDVTAMRSEMRAEFGMLREEIDDVEVRLRAEMQAGFAQVNLVLLDHTDRLARLETAAGLPRAESTQSELPTASTP